MYIIVIKIINVKLVRGVPAYVGEASLYRGILGRPLPI